MEASTSYKASPHATQLAFDNGVDLDLVVGTGRESSITKADVQLVIDRQSEAAPESIEAAATGFSNIMEAQKAARANQLAEVAAATGPPEPATSDVIELPSQEEMFALMQAMKSELTELRGLTAGLIDRDSYDVDLTDAMFYIAKPNGLHWEERRVRDKRTVAVEFRATAFFGPFSDQDKIEEYLTEKRKKREDSYIDWEDVKFLTGKDARLLDRQEKEAREAEFSNDISTNVLDRRIWDTQSQSDGGTGQIVGPAA